MVATVSVPLALRAIRAYQLYVNGKTVEEISVLEGVELREVALWRERDEWDERLARAERELRDNIDGEMRTWAKTAVETVGMTAINSLVLVGDQIQKRLSAKDVGEMSTPHLVSLSSELRALLTTMHELTKTDGEKGKKVAGGTKPKNLNRRTSNPIPPVPEMDGGEPE